MQVATQIREVVEPIVAAAGLFCEDIVASTGKRIVVRVVIDLPDGPGGVDADRLADVSREVSEALDAADVVPASYTLEVTTPGIGRPLTTARHFRRAVGRLLSVATSTGRVRGHLREVDGEQIVIETSSGPQRLDLSQVTKATVEPDLRSGDR